MPLRASILRNEFQTGSNLSLPAVSIRLTLDFAPTNLVVTGAIAPFVALMRTAEACFTRSAACWMVDGLELTYAVSI